MKIDKEKLVVINVLTKEYFDDCHIPGSINIPHDQLEDRIESLDKDKYYVLYCAVITCPLSRNCTKLLMDAGFKHVWAYEGGIVAWFQKGYATQGPAQLDYLHEEIDKNAHVSNEIPTISAEQLLEMVE